MLGATGGLLDPKIGGALAHRMQRPEPDKGENTARETDFFSASPEHSQPPVRLATDAGRYGS